MALEFEFYLSPNCFGTNRKRYHARPTNQETVDGSKFIEKMCKHSVAKPSEAKATMTQAADLLAELLAEGKHVHIDGIGSFQVSLSCPETRNVTATRSGSVGVRSVTFKPAKELVEQVRKKVVLKRARVKKHSNGDSSIDLLLVNLKDYFSTNRFLTVKVLEKDFGILRTTAQRRIRTLVEMGKIRNISNDSRHPIYEAMPDAFKE